MTKTNAQQSKCPNCGAPISGAVCIYCGTPVTTEAAEDQLSRGKRTSLDRVLIVAGILWCVLVLYVSVDLAVKEPPAGIGEFLAGALAALMTASPGIVLLLIGFRRKKPKK